jgi:hypothetical protein
MELHKDLESCIEALEECVHQCQHCVAHDVKEGGHMAVDALLCLDCADACSAALNALARGSQHHGDFCKLAAHLCGLCATECEKHAGEHQHCAKAAAACRACAAECQKHVGESDM